MTVKRFFHKSFPALSCALILLLQPFPLPAAAGEQDKDPVLKLNAQSAVLMDADTGRVLYGKEEDIVRPMASTTKIMTCILALEYGDPEDEVTVSSYAAGQPRVHLGAPAGRRFRMGDLLYSLMLESHNDTAVMLAEYVAGDVKSFAAMMNDKAAELGCKNTWFINPNGLDAREITEEGEEKFHGTTAEDLARIMSYCTWQSPKSREFLTVTRTQNYYFTDLDGKGQYSCVNHNALLTMMDQVLSGKTGFTGGAGYSYVASLEDEGRRYVIVLLGCGWPPHKSYKWSDARTLFRYGMDTYHKEPLREAPDPGFIPVDDGIPGDGQTGSEARADLRAGVRTKKDPPEILLKEGEQVQVRVEVPRRLRAPVRKGQQVGTIIYSVGDTEVYSEPVYVQQEVRKISLSWCLEQTVRMFLQ